MEFEPRHNIFSRELALMYIKTNEPNIALSHFQKSLEIYNELKNTSK